MTAPREEARRRLLDELSLPIDGTPDVTNDVMARLGFMESSNAVVRRRRRARLALRGAIGLATVALAIAAVFWHAGSDRARTPVETTLVEAVAHDMNEQRERVRRSIESVRLLLPAPSELLAPIDDPSEPLPEEADRSGMGPIDDHRWASPAERPSA